MISVGIDPGLSGAIGCLDKKGTVLRVVDMPVSAKTSGKKQIDPYALKSILNEIKDLGEPLKIYVEWVSAMPGQGVTSMFTFGEGCGVIRGVLACLDLQYEYVSPVRWKRLLGLIGKDKDYARTLACQTINGAAPYLGRKKDIGRADALLLAHYGFTK